MKRFPEPCLRLRLRRSLAADTPDKKAALAADTEVWIAMELEVHSAKRMSMPDQACWVVAAAEAWAPPGPALRTVDKPWHLRAWKPHT
jgi:hypothetical protein